MQTIKTGALSGSAAIAAAMFIPRTASLAEDDIEWVTTFRGRYEVAIGAHSWPGLADLDTAREGKFDAGGFNISFAAHWPVRRFAASELLAGVDVGLFANESDIRFISETLIARNGYLVPSVKWMFGDRHRYSIDAGVGYYLQDIAEIAGEYPMNWETQLWENGAIGAYVGGTVDFMGGVPSNSRGGMMSLKVHLVDFGTVRDEGRLAPTLGQDAGSLAGPIYMYQVGWRWR